MVLYINVRFLKRYRSKIYILYCVYYNVYKNELRDMYLIAGFQNNQSIFSVVVVRRMRTIGEYKAIHFEMIQDIHDIFVKPLKMRGFTFCHQSMFHISFLDKFLFLLFTRIRRLRVKARKYSKTSNLSLLL